MTTFLPISLKTFIAEISVPLNIAINLHLNTSKVTDQFKIAEIILI